MVKYKCLASEGYLGAMRVKNRIVMPAMGTGLASISGEVTPQMIRYYEERARGGAGLIVVEVACVDSPRGLAGPTQLRIDSPSLIPGLNELAEAISGYGCRCLVQLHHAGRQTSPALNGGHTPVAPSPLACRLMQVVPEELSVAGVKDITRKYINSALYAHAAGFDGVELHAAHGYLLSQFISPYSNRRTDEYGGSTENRARLLTDIISAIKNILPGFVVGVRLNLTDFVKGGLEIEEGVAIASLLETAGADYINASGGIYESGQMTTEPSSFQEGWRIYLADAVKAKVSIPVIAGGVIRHPAVAEEIINSGRADFVWVGRGMLADPAWAGKALAGTEDRIRPCLSCNTCIGRTFTGLHIRCAVNPYTTREWRLGRPQNLNLRVLVAGGGPAGMQAALELAAAGCQVDLLERSGSLGGQLSIALRPPHKERIAWLLEYLQREIDNSPVKVHLHCEFDKSCLDTYQPDAVVVAVGSQPIISPLPGTDSPKVVSLENVLNGTAAVSGQKVLVIGGGTTGCELAEYLLDRQNQVIIVEKEKELARGLETMTRLDLLFRLKRKAASIKTSCIVKSIEEHQVVIAGRDNHGEEILKPDKIVFACGYKADQNWYRELQDKVNHLYIIGDASIPRGIEAALYEGTMVMHRLQAALSK